MKSTFEKAPFKWRSTALGTAPFRTQCLKYKMTNMFLLYPFVKEANNNKINPNDLLEIASVSKVIEKEKKNNLKAVGQI